MDVVGARMREGECFIPEVLLSARVMQACLDLLRPHMAAGDSAGMGTVVIGTVEGDLHDIGKNLVGMLVYVAEGMWEAGTDGMDFDTAGAAGDGDFLATLTAIEKIKGRYPDIGIELGMASEYVLGMHGELTYKGRRLAGMWPKEQLEVAQEAGATMFGPAVNVNTTKSVAWNVARACTIIKPCMDVAEIPVHPNVGMGVGGVPMSPYPPADAVSRVSRALVDILKCDGL